MPSFMSKFSAVVIRMSGRKRMYANPVKCEKYIEKLGEKSEKPFALPPFPYRSKTEKNKYGDFEIITFNKGRKKKMLYLHGGAFCEAPLLPHFMFCDNISSHTDYEIIFPIYKRAPRNDFKPTFAFLEAFYRELIKKTEPENIVFAGDSSGGGMALSFCEYLNKINLPQPERMILLSPWLDVSMDTPFTREVDKVDPNLQYDFLKTAGKIWAGDEDTHDYRVSPVYGDLTGLAPMTVYFGTHENFINDARIFKAKCEEAGAELDMREWEGMNHVFVIYPIPEAKKAQREIIDMLK